MERPTSSSRGFVTLEQNRWITDLHWVREGQQTRSQRTQAALLDAAEALYSENGLDATSVADIADRAGCSVGAVYHHFSDKKAVLYALFDRLSVEFDATVSDAIDPRRWEGANVADILHTYVAFALAINQGQGGFTKIGLEASRHDPMLADRYTKLVGWLDEGLAELILARRDEIGHPDPELAIRVVLDQIGSMLRARNSGPRLSTRLHDASDEVFLVEVTRSVCDYLQVARPGLG